MKMFKVLGLILLIALLASMSVMAGGQQDKGGSTEPAAEAKELTEGAAEGQLPKNFTIGKIPITLANGYHQADVEWFKKYAEEQYGAKVKVLDGKFEQATIVANLDQLVAEGVDAIVLHTYEAESVEAGIEAARAAGIPIITFYLQTDNDIPFVAINEATQAFEMGVATANAWEKFHPDEPIIYGVVDYVDSPVVQAMRTGPFIEGLKSVAPNAKEGMILDGGGTRDTGYKAAQDMIQSHPEINVFYGASSDYSLAILPALEEAGRGKAVNGVPETEILVGTDATEAELVKIFDPSSSFKVTMGLTPRENAILKVDTIVKAYLGEIDPDKRQTIEATDKEIDYWSADIDEIQTWLEEEYMTEVNLKK
jgi:ribose transport system substrate-binding protein